MKKEFWLIIILGLIIVVLFGLLMWPEDKDLDVKNLNIKANQKITSPLVAEGEALGTWFFEASFPIKVTDEAGNILGTSFVQAQSDWMTENFVPFKGEINFVSEKEQKGFLVLSKDNPSGLPENDKEIKIPVLLTKTRILPETTKIKLYFGNSNLDPENSCNKVFAVERDITKTEGIARATIEELLKGPTQAEKDAGFFTSINAGVKLNSIDILKSNPPVAKIDFDEQLQFQVGGSCKVSAIRAEITETLKQFPTIEEVIISINGNTEDILQP